MSTIFVYLSETELESLKEGGTIVIPIDRDIDHSDLSEIDISFDPYCSPGRVEDHEEITYL